jgi:hypothetical protein
VEVEEAALTTPSDNDNSFNKDYKKQKERGKQKRNTKDDFDEDLEYEPVHKKKKSGNQKFIAQTAQNDWNSDEYVDAKNDLFIETDYLTAKSKKISNSTVKRDGLLATTTTKKAAPKGKNQTTSNNVIKKTTANPRSPAKKSRTLVLSEDDSF